MDSLLQINNLNKSFKDKKVLQSLSLKLRQGDILGLIGKSGCGKSTLFKILVGYYRADAGKIFYKGREITKFPDAIKKIVGYTTQENSFYEKLTVYENMEYYANLFNVSADNLKEHICSILDSVQLLDAKDRLAENISGGMKRRLDFAISLIHNPEILILDEPTTGLDPLLIDQFWGIVMNVVKKGDKAVIISSHILGEVQKYCSRIAVMKDGKINTVIDKKKVRNLNLDKIFRELNR